MTENEKIECAIHCMKVQADMELCEDCKAYSMDSSTCEDIAREGYKELEELKQYREIGTVEQIKDIKRKTISDFISTMEKELEHGCSSVYECVEGTRIITDAGFVHDWFEEYKDILKKRYGIE